jgi:hypothetical protein
VHELEKKQGIFEGIWSRMRPAGEMRFRFSIADGMIVPVTIIDSVVVFVPFEPGCANASNAISVQATVTIVFFIMMPPC